MSASTAIHTARPTAREQLLRRAIQADAFLCAAAGLVFAAAAAPLGALLGIPSLHLLVLGFILMPYAAFLGYAATRERISRRAAWSIIAVNALWALDSLILLATGLLPLTTAGWWFVLIQAGIVADFAIVQAIAIRRAV